MTSSEHELLTVKEVAEILRLTERSVRRALKARAIRFTRLGANARRSVVRISRSDLDRYIAGGVVEAAGG